MPDNDDLFERMTILERAEFLHASTLRRHSETLEQHAERLALLERLIADQQRMQQSLLDVSARLETTMQAIKDLLDRGRNGH
jgi:hypothetical protein